MRGNRKAAPLGTQSLGSSSFPARAYECVGVYVSESHVLVSEHICKYGIGIMRTDLL